MRRLTVNLVLLVAWRRRDAITQCLFIVLLILLSLLLTTSCMARSPSVVAPTSNVADKDVCIWAAKASIVKAQRIVAAESVYSWFSKHNLLESDKIKLDENLRALTESDWAEMTRLLTAYLPHQESFVEHWRELEPIQKAQPVWETELRAAETRLVGLKDILAGETEQDWDRWERGWQMCFVDASRIGKEADLLFAEIMTECLK